jgi:hypothetical protein
LCIVDIKQKIDEIEKFTGGKSNQIDELEAMCDQGSDFRTLLERFVFQFNFAKKLQSHQNLCKISENNRYEITQNFFNSLKSSQIEHFCIRKNNFDAKYILREFYNMDETHNLVPSSFCLVSNSSRSEIIKHVFKIDGSDMVDKMENFCKVAPGYQNLPRSVSIITKTLKKHFKNSLWTNVPSLIFGHENCSFLTVESVFREVLSLDKLRLEEVNEIKGKISKLKQTLKSAMDNTQSIVEMYVDMVQKLEDYEEKIEAFANFRTFDIAVFRSFTMFTGEFDSEKFSGPLRMVMLLLFIFFMLITLQNLMNGIALIDAQQIINEAQIIGIKKRISLVFTNENLATILFKDRATIFSTKVMNRFMLTPSKGRQLVLFDPLKVHMSKTLMLSKESFKDIVNFCDSKK